MESAYNQFTGLKCFAVDKNITASKILGILLLLLKKKKEDALIRQIYIFGNN